jgi:diguanylate cyclase (GGDEF)-like protein/PAS domain S-box-containing protein
MPANEDFYRQILDESSDPIFSFFPDGTYRYVNKAFASGVSRPVDEIIGRRIWDVFPKEEADKRYKAVKQAFETGEERVIEVKVEVGDTVNWYMTTVKPIRTPSESSISAVICVSKNITERKRAEEHLRYYATTDELTGVVNRRTGLAILQKMIELTRRNGRTCCLIYADINGLKQVNDRLGHSSGDRLIIACCYAMSHAIRQSDTLCRMGGDEFLLLLPECDRDLALKINQRIDENLVGCSRDQPWQASLSRGLFGFEGSSMETAESLLRKLDELMYANKRLLH